MCAPSTDPGQAWQLVIHHGGHMELQQFDILGNDVSSSSILLVSPQLIVNLHNVSQFVSQVILGEGGRVCESSTCKSLPVVPTKAFITG